MNSSNINLTDSLTLAFFDSKVEDYKTLIRGLKNNIKAFILDSEQDGIVQISNIIAQYQNIKTIHILAHGIPGKLYLGNSELSLDTLNFYQNFLKSWCKSTKQSSLLNLLIYGCEVGAGDAGSEFIEKVYQLTKANIHASTTLVGNSQKGGNWELDLILGDDNIKADLAFSNEILEAYKGVFASTGSNSSYVFYDSTDPSGKGTVAFTDIGGTGTRLNVTQTFGEGNKDWETVVSLPPDLSFKFEGTNYTSIVVAENGAITFGNTAQDISGTNGDLRSLSQSVANTIYPFWTNLNNDSTTGGDIWYKAEGSKFIIQWDRTELNTLQSNDGGTFQVVLHLDTSRIDFVYKDVNFNPSSFDLASFKNGNSNTTIGIRGANSALQYLWSNGTGVQDGNSLLVNNVPITSISFYVNDAPTLSGVTSSFTYTEPFNTEGNSTTPAIIDSDVTLSSASLTNLNGGNLTVSYNSGVTSTDQLSIVAAGTIGLSGSNVSYNGTVIGTIDATQNGINGQSLKVNLNASATLTAVEALIEHLGYRTTSNAPAASRSINIAVNDGNGGTNNGVASANVTINVTPGNDAPTNTIPGTQTVDEDTPLVFSSANGNQISISDVDLPTTELFQVELTSTNGKLTLGSLTGLTFNTGDGTNDSSLKFSGTIANINNALNGMSFIPDLNFNSSLGSASIQIKTDDLGNIGGSSLTDTDTISINVTPVNDAPVNQGIANQTVAEDTELLITTLSISDVDVNETDNDVNTNNTLRVTFSVNNGTVKLKDTTGLSFVAGNNTGLKTITVEGTLVNINAALTQGLIYKGDPNYNQINGNGSDTLTMTTNDQGNTGKTTFLVDTDSFNITVTPVNDAPINTVPLAQQVNEDTELIFSQANGNQISIADVDVNETPNSTLKVTLSVNNGTLKFVDATNIVFEAGNDNSGRSSISFTGTLANINNALATGLIYKGNLNYNEINGNGNDTLSISTDDQNNTGSGGNLVDNNDTVTITVKAVNDAPVNTVPDTTANPLVVNEDTDLTITSLSIQDVDVNETSTFGNILQLTLSVNNGTVKFVNTTGLTFATGNNNNGNAAVTVTGTLEALNAALTAGVIYRGGQNYNGNDTLTLTTNDLNNTGSEGAKSDIDTVAIRVDKVNDAPVVTLASNAQSVNEDTNLVFNSANGNQITISDVDINTNTNNPNQQSFADQQEVTLTVTKGVINLGSVNNITNLTGNGTNTITFRGTIANVNNALNGLTYLANQNYNGSDTLTITTNDLGNSGIDGQNSPLENTKTVALTVNKVNDAPAVTIAQGSQSQSLNEDGQLTVTGISISDVDTDAAINQQSFTDEQQVTLTVNKGTLTLGSTANLLNITGDGTNTVSFKGTIASLNAALAQIQYDSNENYNGNDTLTITTNDLGNSGIAGQNAPLQNTKTIDLIVNKVNDAPVVNVAQGSQSQSVNEDTELMLAGINISDIDVDVNLNQQSFTDQQQVTLTVTNGVLKLGVNTGLTEIVGNQTNTLTFKGSVANINAALAQLKYQGNQNYNGNDTLTITTNDLGNSGVTGQNTPFEDTKTVALTINKVNDAPVNTVPTTQTVNEDDELNLSGLSINDVDVNPDQEQLKVTLSVNNGTLKLNDISGLTFTNGNNSGSSASITFTGTLNAINTALGGLVYKGNQDFYGTDTLTMTTSDQGNIGTGNELTDIDTVNIKVLASRDLGEYGTIWNLDHNWQTIYLEESYLNPVIIVSDPTLNGGDPAVVRLRNVTNQSFEVRIQEPNYADGIHSPESVSYVVVEAGHWELADGTRISAGVQSSNLLSSQGFESVALYGFDGTPTVLTQVQSYNGADWVTTRTTDIFSNRFSFTMQEEEALNWGTHQTESVGWLAIEQGTAKDAYTVFESRLTSQNYANEPQTIKFTQGFSSAPVVLAKLGSFYGGDTANVRLSEISDSDFQVRVYEEQSLDAEMRHGNEQVAFLALEDRTPDGNNKIINGKEVAITNVNFGEYGTLSDVSHRWQTITLNNSYVNPVVIVSDSSFKRSDPVVVRLRNVDSNSFELRLQEPGYKDGIHTGESLSYLVVEAGDWELADGTRISAGIKNSNLLSSQGFESVAIDGFDETPTVLTQVQTNHGADWVTTRTKDISSNGFALTMQEEEAFNGGSHKTESIGWLAIDQGVGNDGDSLLQGGLTANDYGDQPEMITFDQGFQQGLTSTPIVLAKLASFAGVDPATLRLGGISNSGFRANVYEEQSFDAEMIHTDEQVAFLAFGNASGILTGGLA